MRLVLDASAAVTLALSSDGFRPVGAHRLTAPALMWSEAISVLHRGAVRGRFSRELAIGARDRILTGPVSRIDPPTLASEAWSVADLLGWTTTYDAEYVALARLLRSPLVTVDERLRRGAARLIEVMGPSEVPT